MIARRHFERDQLQEFLSGSAETHSAEIAAHVEQCSQYQSEIESIVAADFDWEEVSDLLGSPGAIDSLSADAWPLVGPWAGCLLESSDYPGSLGRFGRYEVLRCLGRGGMGIVFRVFDPELHRYSAVKVLSPEFAGHAAARRRFSREAKSAAAVVHCHVVPIQTVDEHNGLPYLVMPVVEGQSLQQRVDRSGPLSIVETVRIASQIAAGLAAAHFQGLVHRDIKPANILLENGVERVQITDFGLARAVDDASMTRSGVIAGTPQYMSPEQARGDEIDHRSDLFSLGSVIYFMLTGRSPFRAETMMGVLNRIGNDPPRKLRTVNPDVPEWLEAIVMKLLEKERSDRFQDAEQLSGLLARWQAHLQNPDEVAMPEASRRSGRRMHPTAKWFLGLGLGSALVWLFSIIILQTGQGTLRIESNTEMNVPIVIRQGADEVQHLTVSKAGTTTRLHAGEYVIEIDGATTGFELTGNRFTLKRGTEWIARIEQQSATGSTSPPLTEKSTRLPIVWESSDIVRLDDAFADKLQFNQHSLETVNKLLSETWRKYIQLELKHTTYSRTENGALDAKIAGFPEERRALTLEFHRRLGEAVTGPAREFILSALGNLRGNKASDDIFRVRADAYPNVMGWKDGDYPVWVQISVRGDVFHWYVRPGKHGITDDGKALPPELAHYLAFGQKRIDGKGPLEARAPEVKWDSPPSQRSAGLPTSPEFVPVRIAVLGENGVPIPGAQVRMRLSGNTDRPMEVEDASEKDGVAIDQLLPYGKYTVEVSTPDGWQFRRVRRDAPRTWVDSQ